MARSGVLIIFTRKPAAGKTKTRLIPALGADGAARLHRKLLLQTVEIATRSDFTSCEVHVYPDRQDNFIQQLSTLFGAGIHVQTGNDLGERMCNAARRALKQYDFAVIIGCDIPSLAVTDLDRAYKILLERQADAVIGPSEDGGYYLIGMDRDEPSLFNGIEWGTAEVLAQTRKKLAGCGMHWIEQRMLWDIDNPEDLARLQGSPGLRIAEPVNIV